MLHTAKRLKVCGYKNSIVLHLIINRFNLKSVKSTYLCRTAISFSMLFSLPSNAFLGIHLMATSFWVLFSSARTTSEKAPLKHKHKGQSVRHRSIYRRLFSQSSSQYIRVTEWRCKTLHCKKDGY